MKNNIFTGILLSLLVTAFGAALLYVVKYQPHNLSVSDYLQDLRYDATKRSAILSLSLLANIPLIYFHQKRRLMKTIYGIGAVIAVMCVMILLAKFG